MHGPHAHLEPRVGNMRVLEGHELRTGRPVSGVDRFIDLQHLKGEKLSRKQNTLSSQNLNHRLCAAELHFPYSEGSPNKGNAASQYSLQLANSNYISE